MKGYHLKSIIGRSITQGHEGWIGFKHRAGLEMNRAEKSYKLNYLFPS
jgi:hypothetical protein